MNASSYDGSTPLHKAVSLGLNTDIAEILLANGADTNIQDEYGETPLHVSAFADNKSGAELLITYGADLDKTDNKGHTALDSAIHYKNWDIADLLKKHGAKTSKELEEVTQETKDSQQ